MCNNSSKASDDEARSQQHRSSAAAAAAPAQVKTLRHDQATVLRRWALDFVDDSTNVSAPPPPPRSHVTRAAIDEHMHPPGFPTTYSARDPTPFVDKGSTTTLRAVTDNDDDDDDDDDETNNNTTNKDRRQSSSAVIQRSYNHSWKVAFSPIRPLCTSWFALYITGDRLNTFSLVTTVTVLLMQLRSLLATRDAFRPIFKAHPFSVVTLLPQIVIHALVICVGVAYALYKANVLGFLPTTESDWIALLPVHTVAPMTFRHVPSHM